MPGEGSSAKGAIVVGTQARCLSGRRIGWAAVAAIAWLSTSPSLAQDGGLQPGEAFLTRFSGVTSSPGPTGQPTYTIDLNGTVGSIIDLRAPRQAPRGDHWIYKLQRSPVTARD